MTKKGSNDEVKNSFAGQNDPRICGISSYGNEEIVVLNKGFLQVVKNDNCPPWSIKADKITYDKISKNIIYSNFEPLQCSCILFSKFFHPDPSVERRSGLLQPRLNNSNVLGSSINLPCFHILSDNKI